MTKISIIIPVYNIENYLNKCLDSILAQTFEDFEIICVNDGSKDNSLSVLNEYQNKDSRIKIISQKNGGSGSARNRGLEEACGEYIQFLDGDDYFEPQMLEKLYDLIATHSADIAACSSRKVDEEGNVTESRNPNSPINLYKTPFNKPFSYKDFPNDIFSLIGTMPWNKLYKRDLILKNKLSFPKLTGPDDLCFVYMTYACAESIVVIDDELINYRFNRAGSVQTYRAKHASDIIKAAIFVRDFLIKRGLYELLKPAYIQAFTNAIRWETSLCNEEEYSDFIKNFKELMPKGLEIFKSALRKDFITIDYLNNFIGNKKVMLWGAGIFTQKLLSQETVKNPNILGIIDKNEASWGNMCGNYKIYGPSAIEKMQPDGVLLTVLNNNETIYPALKQELKNTHPNIELLPNIFKN